MTESEIYDAVEKFASTPREEGDNRFYPTDEECDAYERALCTQMDD